jgi:quinol monooxygenase YgiN
MLLATTQVEDFDRFLEIFSTKGADKRKEHGCKGARVFRDPAEDDRVWVAFDWDEQGWQSFVSDPEVPSIRAAGRAQGTAAGGAVRRRVLRLTSAPYVEEPRSRGALP